MLHVSRFDVKIKENKRIVSGKCTICRENYMALILTNGSYERRYREVKTLCVV